MKTQQRLVTAILALILALFLRDASAHPGHNHDNEVPTGMRTWTEANGVFQLDASFVAALDGKVQLRKKDGKLATLSIDQLSDDDQHWIKHRQAEIRKMNEQPAATLLALAPDAKPNSAEATKIAKAFEPFAKLKAIKYRSDERYFYVESNGMPDHPMMVGITAWQQQVPLPQKYFSDNAWQIPLHPVPAKEPASAKNRFLRGAIALAVNGIPIFNPLNNRGDDAFLFGELDEYGGHCGRADDYHYHLAPVHLEKQVGKGKVVAYALDGYPIYGYDEPDGSKVVKLDWLNGHKGDDGHYHYHATKTYPYLNGGFYGEVTERDGQVDPQPRAQPLREALPPLRGAKIVGFTSPKTNDYNLIYEVNGRKGHVNYTIAADGSVAFNFTDPTGKASAETYAPRQRGPGGPGGGDRRPPPRPGENRPPRDGKRPPPRPGENPPPRPGENPPPRSDTPTKSKPRGDLPQLDVTSSALDANGFISAEFTCDGASASPPVQWKDAPQGTRSFALSLWHTAPDQEKSYWVIYNIPTNTTKIPKNGKNIGIMGVNDKRRAEYDPMCSKGPGVKAYHITVYALSAELKLSPDQVSRANLLAAIKDITVADGTLDFKYERKK